MGRFRVAGRRRVLGGGGGSRERRFWPELLDRWTLLPLRRHAASKVGKRIQTLFDEWLFRSEPEKAKSSAEINVYANRYGKNGSRRPSESLVKIAGLHPEFASVASGVHLACPVVVGILLSGRKRSRWLIEVKERSSWLARTSSMGVRAATSMMLLLTT